MTIYCDESGGLNAGAMTFAAVMLSSEAAAAIHARFRAVTGLRGESMLKSDYTRMLDCSFDRTIELAEDASRRGWISLKRVGQVVEVLFPNLISAQEMEWLREQN